VRGNRVQGVGTWRSRTVCRSWETDIFVGARRVPCQHTGIKPHADRHLHRDSRKRLLHPVPRSALRPRLSPHGRISSHHDHQGRRQRSCSDWHELASPRSALLGEQLLRGDTAVRTGSGSRIQAFCRNRNRLRVIQNWGRDHYESPAIDDGGLSGSSIALFGAPADSALDTIGAIELTRRAGLSYLYQSSPFETWGHLHLNKEHFPDGWRSFKRCVDTAADAGIRIGFHTLSNFITTNDPYVTPRPDPRLARIGSTTLPALIDATQDAIPIDDPLFFTADSVLNTVMIGDELIQYESVSQDVPYRLLGCQRGSWDTVPVSHSAGERVGRLMDHGYKVFLTDIDLSQEVAERIADFCNQTGAAQLSFDGLEGNFSTGLGHYAVALFTKAWYDRLDPALQGQVINDASMPDHYNWHTYTRMNWGEPWYAGFRESQTQYRLQNQHYYRRNLMPRMLGWFTLQSDTCIEDIEWLLARAAGFDAGFALSTSVEFAGDQIRTAAAIDNTGDQTQTAAAIDNSGEATGSLDEILAAIRVWETARMAGAFPEALKEELQDINREFHLEQTGEGRWVLYPVHSHKERLESPSPITIDNPHPAQPLQFILRNAGEKPIAGITLEVANQIIPLCDSPLNPGASIRYSGGDGITVFSGTSRRRNADQRYEKLLKAQAGGQNLKLSWSDT
jgi:hypothetical protein